MSWLKQLFGKAASGDQPESGPGWVERSEPELHLSANDDPLYRDAANFVRSSGTCSVSAIQRHLKVGYNRAATLIECLENDLVISPMSSCGSRHVFTETERQAASLLPSKAELEQQRIDVETALRLSYLLEKHGDTQLVSRIMSGAIWETMTSEQLYDSVGQPESVDLREKEQHPLLLAPMMQLIAFDPPVLWIVGDTWVRCENCEYTIGADEPATREQVRQLLIKADWDAQQWLSE